MRRYDSNTLKPLINRVYRCILQYNNIQYYLWTILLLISRTCERNNEIFKRFCIIDIYVQYHVYHVMKKYRYPLYIYRKVKLLQARNIKYIVYYLVLFDHMKSAMTEYA